jgi:predicted ATPase
MCKIIIKNFGPIKEGYQEDEGWIDVKKVTIFIGNQGSGKSTVAKLISTLSWIEKAVYRGDIQKDLLFSSNFYSHFKYQRIEKYFKEETYIEYQGEYAHLIIKNRIGDCQINIKNGSQLSILPKIMYVPAERNFLTVVQDAYNVTNIPDTLRTFGVELKKSMRALNEELLELPIGKEKIKYSSSRDQIYLVLDNLDLEISDSSSGYQSLVPLFAVTKYLNEEIASNKIEVPNSKLSIDQSLRREEQIEALLLDDKIQDDFKTDLIEKINRKFHSSCLINIVEEPEQNLFPTTQQKVLYSLLAFNNRHEGNKLIMTTHSPYIINFLSLAVQANYLYNELTKSESAIESLQRLESIVPVKSLVDSKDLTIYQLDESTGLIFKLASTDGIPSDKNYLNQSLQNGNELFDMLLEIEQEL